MTEKKELIRRIYSKKEIEKVNRKISLLGVSSNYSASFLLNLRLISSLAIFLVTIYIVDYGYILSPIITFLYYISFFNIFIDTKIKKREYKLEREATYFFEVLTLSLEAGRGLKNAIEVTTNNVDGELSLEFRKVINDMNLGKTLNETLNDLKFRIPSDTINNIILNIRESNIFGNSIIDTMHSQIDYLREKRILRAKADISKVPVKISIISVLFFIPLLLLLLLGPLLIELLM